MRRMLLSICVCPMVFTVTARGSQGSVPDPDATAPTTVPAFSQEADKEVQQTEPLQSVSGENASVMEETSKEEGSGVLIVCFSATGTTKILAGYISEVTGGDLYEIVSEILYSSEDLNYSDNSSRNTKEQNGEGIRLVISDSVGDMDQYETIFLNYSIWRGEAPYIIDTFMESHDSSGKMIVPFCTSGSSGIGSSTRNLHGLVASDVAWLDGEQFGSDISHEGMANWIDGLSLDGTVR